MSRLLSGSLILTALVGGCVPGRPIHPTPHQQSGVRFAAFKDLNPVAFEGPSAQIESLGMKIPVEVKATTKEGVYGLELVSHGEVIETERYRFTERSFGFLDTRDEAYDPEIPLAKFPMEVGETWSWKGSLTSTGTKRNASATVTTGVESFALLGGADAYKVIVELQIDAGAPKPAEKALTFWIVPGKGVVKRSFGFALTRTLAEGK